MRDRISCIAQENRRSMNSEIVMRIDHSLARQGYQTDEVMHLDDAELSPHERELLVQFVYCPFGSRTHCLH
ncbi:Arc family DNA-binding protein (plasmid) [Pseudomonas sp. HR96]|uniref:Arc family DNA-binding protein n=1 Tax=Pseudomonas sp. HR96 TaxID=1027966 RepID=UPI002A75718D|nr:Arc family DNA-binding protein [Pseudomonas sp. HR96]WPP02519.1 Arc family DNA-binding protein [Pseudomonas sp. HR96]